MLALMSKVELTDERWWRLEPLHMGTKIAEIQRHPFLPSNFGVHVRVYGHIPTLLSFSVLRRSIPLPCVRGLRCERGLLCFAWLSV
jgi:hypothetical protein